MRVYLAALIGVIATSTFNVEPVAAWDPIGDLRDPRRIVRNAGREIGNAGREIDRMRIEAQANAGSPAFEAWLNRSRADASRGSMPIPPHIRQQLAGFYSDAILNRARFKIGDPGVFNLANLSIRYGSAAAVTLIDVIVFKNHNDAYYNPTLWAHELKHVEQFANWGTRDFTIRYLRSWNSVENEAYDAQNRFAARAQQQPAPWPPAPQHQTTAFPSFPQGSAASCTTPFGYCLMGVGVPIGAQCYCPSPRGPIWGFAR
ncbi:DUF4157 domain-containing protein [Hyphomicrobium sp. CS1BSMeth3]|uniref:eCIS core domain-containing protein n=1 Tax=Hyphomicrobium sp. CS1BSMeth3 TaxID=1892844 RepID=UPI0009F92ED3|nr:DUF4157 domain-containing protein [Hyphomicrobium sp. CS1BSMeth3]